MALFVAGVALAGLAGAGTSKTQAGLGTIFLVTKFDDTFDGFCDFDDCSLREAVAQANSTEAADQVRLPAGTYTLSLGPDSCADNTNSCGDLNVGQDLTVQGAGPGVTVIDANDVDRIFTIEENGETIVDVEITGVTMRDGFSETSVGGALSVSRQTAVILTETAFVSNEAAIFGGAIYVSLEGSLSITDSTLNANRSNHSGGALGNRGTLSISNSTISGNVTRVTGGGLWRLGPGTSTTVTNTTIAGNRAGSGGAGIAAPGYSAEPLRIRESALSNVGPDCSGYLVSHGLNISDDSSCNLVHLGDRPATEPLLAPLADNGGLTKTRTLLPGSPAIDMVPPEFCASSRDQRGMPRPSRGRCDPGAVEVGFCFGLRETRVGTEFSEALVGTTEADVIFGLDGDDAITARGGDDAICGDSGADSLDGGLGTNDRRNGGPGSDTDQACERRLNIP